MKFDKFFFSVMVLLLLSFIVSGAAKGEELSYNDSPREIVIQIKSINSTLPQVMRESKVPEFTLYGDGRLIYLARDENKDVKLFESKVEPDQIEYLLEFIKRQGFDKFNENYLNVTAENLDTTYITVKTKDSKKTVSVYGYSLAVYQGIIPRALMNIHTKLIEYRGADEKEYEPERIAVLVAQFRSALPEKPKIEKWGVKKFDLVTHAFSGISLEERYKSTTVEGKLMKEILNKLKGKTLYESRSGFLNLFFKEKGKLYRVAYRPFLPYE